MEGDKRNILGQFLNAQIKWAKPHVWWRCAARILFDCFEDTEPRLFKLIGRIDALNIRSRRMENRRSSAEASAKNVPIEVVFSVVNVFSCATADCVIAVASVQ